LKLGWAVCVLGVLVIGVFDYFGYLGAPF